MHELMINLKTKSKLPLYEQIYNYIKQDIQNGKIVCGEKLPSTRALSKYLEVSRSTVELAYEQLLSEGYIEAEPCKGFYVAQIEGLYQWKEKPVLQVEKMVKPEKTYRYDFTASGIDLEGFPFNTWRKLSKEVLAEYETGLFQAGQPQGEYSFRNAICNYLYQARGVNCTPEQVVVGAGNDYLLMLLSLVLGEHKKIAFETPTYKQAYRLFSNLSYDVRTVDMDEKGIVVDKLRKTDTELVYVMPSHHYPLGTVMPIKRRMELLKWAAEEKERYIIEDDYDSEFRYIGKPIPALQGMDRNQKVIYLGTFSRSIAPAIRMSYMVLPVELMKQFHETAGFINSTVPKTDQAIVQKFMEGGYYERHLNKMRALYKAKHDIILSGVKEFKNKCEVSGEHAGVHLLLSFKGEVTERELIEAALQKSIKVYGLSEYDIASSEVRPATVILGYAKLSEHELNEAMKLLAEIW